MWDGGNPGATIIRQFRLLPAEQAGGIRQQIIEFLRTAKTEAKIFAKFHARPASEVKALIHELRGKGLIRQVTKNGQKAWQSDS